MKNLFYEKEPEKGYLDEEESGHAVRVLRHKTGDVLQLTDGKGTLMEVKITDAHPKKCTFEIISSNTHARPSKYIHLAIAPTKNADRMEWLVEKAVEIGISELSLILCEHSERRVYKTDRLLKIAIAAMKQSHNFYLPRINELQPYSKFLEGVTQTHKIIALLDNNAQQLSSLSIKEDVCLLVGPEGDFSPKEITQALEKGFKSVLMGNSRLRTETAGLVGITLLNQV